MPPFLSAKISPRARYGTMRDVEETHRISRREQYKLLKEGLIKAKKSGWHTLIDLQSVDDYQDSLPDYKEAATPVRKKPREKAVQP